MAWHKALLIAAAALAIVIVGACLPTTASAANYRVGDDSGWGNDVDYDTWASGKNFKVGDTLEFQYSVGLHDVVLVDAASYEACFVPSNAQTLTSGHDLVTFSGPGQFFFICSAVFHCEFGMKLAVNVQ